MASLTLTLTVTLIGRQGMASRSHHTTECGDFRKNEMDHRGMPLTLTLTLTLTLPLTLTLTLPWGGHGGETHRARRGIGILFGERSRHPPTLTLTLTP